MTLTEKRLRALSEDSSEEQASLSAVSGTAFVPVSTNPSSTVSGTAFVPVSANPSSTVSGTDSSPVSANPSSTVSGTDSAPVSADTLPFISKLVATTSYN